MTKSHRVRNITRQFTLKRNQALAAIENCAATWVEYGVSIRDLTLAESIAKRNEQAANREPLPLAELRNCVFEPPANQSRHYDMVSQANRFCAEYSA
jgi:hypothetical protein